MNTAQRPADHAFHQDSQTFDPHEEFASIEAAVAGTVRGRWFLDEYVRRAQDRDNERIIAALTRIERMLTADAQARQQQAAPPARPAATTFAPPPIAPSVNSSAPAKPGAALPVLAALRASGGLTAPTPAPRSAAPTPTPAIQAQPIAPAQPAPVRSPARSLADTLEHSLLSMSPQGGPAKAEAKKPEGQKLAAAPPVRPPPPFVPPAPAFAPRPAPAAQPALVIDAEAFAQIEAMDAAARAKLFA